MAKSLLILMLTVTQLLTGSGDSVYLCISNDGSFCCFDTGPDSCTCCHDEHREAVHNACCDSCGGVEHAPNGDVDEVTPMNANGSLSATDPCGCTHVLVMMSFDQSTGSISPCNSVDGARLIALLALPPTVALDQLVVAKPLFRRSEPPRVPEFSLIVISTVVIRC